ncbi:REDY-like protein HapK [Thalassotalea maritima]|uniref:REDY-like protein HapK n=1 Tax=Thalassotalea maritima TaxID=3242416 RepID=UPI0035280B12
MTTIVVLFNLKDGVSEADYQQWAKETDLPTAGALPSVDSFEVLRSQGLLMSDMTPPYQYIEILKVNDMATFAKDVSSDVMTRVSAEFQHFADNPMFILCESL